MPQEPGIGIEAQARTGRHVERLLPACEADAVEIHRVVGLDGGEIALLLRDGQHVQRGERRRSDERRVRRRRLPGGRQHGERALCLGEAAQHADVGLQHADRRGLAVDRHLLGRAEIGAHADHDPRQGGTIEQILGRPERVLEPQQAERRPARRVAPDVGQGVGVVAVGDIGRCRRNRATRLLDHLKARLVHLHGGHA